MRRYRKGQTFRPPTAAESAASADAVEAFRRQPQQPQARPRGSDIVKTPANGIPGRDGTTIYSAACLRCVESYEAEEKTLMETDEEIEVFNLDTSDVAGNIYVRPGLTLGGMLCLDQRSGTGHTVIEFSVISLAPYMDELSSPCIAVLAEVLSKSCSATDVEVGDEVIIYDPAGCWFNVPIEVLEGARGQAVSMTRGEYMDVPDCDEEIDYGTCWWLVQHLCCTEELYGD